MHDLIRRVFMPVSALALVIAAQAASQGTGSRGHGPAEIRFVVDGPPDSPAYLIAYYRGRRVLDIPLDGYSLPCKPAFDFDSKRIIVARDQSVEAYSLEGTRMWKKEVDYYYNPYLILATGSSVVYDDGPNAVPPPRSPAQIASALEESYGTQFVISRSTRNGEVRWKRSWLQTGSLCALRDRRSFLTVKTGPHRVLSDFSHFRNARIECRLARTGSLIHAWKLPDWTVGTEFGGRRMNLAEFLSYGSWVKSPGSSDASFVVSADRKRMEFDSDIGYRARCRVRFKGRAVRITLRRGGPERPIYRSITVR